MAQTLPATHIEAHVGDVSGGSQVAIGNYIVQIGRVEGGVVNILNEAPPPPRLLPPPVLLRPRAFPSLLDRQTETANVIHALHSQEPVECVGEPGSGKTSLLRYLAYNPQLSMFSSGVAYFQVNQLSMPDLLHSLFDAFYVCDFPIKPNDTEMRRYLQPVNALVLLDDVEITSEQIKSLMNSAPNCTFLTATTARSLFGEAREVEIKGLPIAEAVSLFRTELGRTLSAGEEEHAQALCNSLGCIPLRVLRAAHQARDEKRSLVDIVGELSAPSEGQAASEDQASATTEINSRSEDEKKVLAALSVCYGAPVAAEHVAAIAGVTNVDEILEDLERRRLVQSHEQRYSLASDVNNAMLGDLGPWFKRALTHFEAWGEQNRHNHKAIEGAAQPILLVLRWAVASKSWPDVKGLGHAVEEALAASGKWDMWATALEAIRVAARAQDDAAESAWALHQLGTRALCLDQRAAAEASLKDALGIRERLNDQRGAAVTRHNLNILLGPPPPPTKPDKSSDGGGAITGTTRIPLALKIGALVLVSLALITALVVWWMTPPNPPGPSPRVLSFSVNPTTIRPNGQSELCYEVENAAKIRIEPNIGERKSATKECLTVTAAQTTTYVLTVVAADGTTTSREIILNVEEMPPLAEILRFEVQRQTGPGGPDDVQFRLCYEVRNAQHAEIDNEGGTVVLNRPNCQPIKPQQTTTYTLSATGSDDKKVTRQATADATKPPPPPPQVLSFTAQPPNIVAGDKTELRFELKDASGVQIEPSVRALQVGTGEQRVSVSPITTTTYTLTAINSEGKSSTRTTVVRVRQPPAEIGRFFANPTFLREPGNVQLCYEVLHVDRLQIDNGIGEVQPGKGCVNTRVSQTTTFTLTATGAEGGRRQSQAKVEVEPPRITIEFTAKPPAVTRPDSASLCYRVSEASSVSIDHGVGRVRVPPSGQEFCVKVQPNQTTIYTLAALGSLNQTATSQVTVNVNEPPKLRHARILSFDVSPSQIKRGGSVRLCYNVADAVRGSIAPGIKEISVGTGCIDDSPQKSTRYTLRVIGEDQQVESKEVTVEVERDREPDVPPVEITRFEINPTALHGTQLCYALKNARSASIEPDFGELSNLDRDCPRLKSLKEQTYTLIAIGHDGRSIQKTASYTPPKPPPELPIRIISFSPSSQTIKLGAQARICYRTLGEGTAQISPQPGSVTPSVLERCVTVAPTKNTAYELIVTGRGGQEDRRRVIVNVQQPVIQ